MRLSGLEVSRFQLEVGTPINAASVTIRQARKIVFAIRSCSDQWINWINAGTVR
jgi:hypothetical protein